MRPLEDFVTRMSRAMSRNTALQPTNPPPLRGGRFAAELGRWVPLERFP